MLQVISICVIFQFLIYVKSEGYYSIVAPGTIRPNFDYHVSVSTHNTKEPSIIEVGIQSWKVIDKKEIQISPNSSKIVNLKLPLELERTDIYRLTVKVLYGTEFQDTVTLDIDWKYKSIFIQTDKALYKPGDLVRFRVLVLDPNTKPTKLDDLVDITIIDSAYNRIKRFKNVELTKGVFSGELQLSQFPLLGNWVIDVASGNARNIKNFEIAKYVVPKFETIIEVPKHILATEKLRVTIRAKYTYGEPVKGDATVTTKFNELNDIGSVTITTRLDGKAYIELNTTELGLINNHHNTLLFIMVSVKEKLTGNTMNASATTQLHYEKYKIELVDAPNTYVINEPFKVTVAVKNFDDTPVQNIKNPVRLALSMYLNGRAGQKSHVQLIEQELNEYAMGTVEFTISERYDKYNYCSIDAKYLEVESVITNISKEIFNEDLSLKVITRKPKLNEYVTVKVMSKNPLKYFIYEVVGRGNILMSDRVNVPNEVKEYELKIKSTFEMVPRSNLYVYFIKDGRIVQKTIGIDFENQLQNFIKIDIPERAKPSEEIDISVSTDPDSYVGLLGIDQSVLLLRNDNDLSKDDIFNELRSFHTKVRDYDEIDSPSDSAGLVMLSNVNPPLNPSVMLQKTWMIQTSDTIWFPNDVEHGGLTIQNSNDLKKKKVYTRKNFCDVWIFDSISDKNGQGKLSIRKKVPDTITSWVISGFSVNSKSGLGLTERPRKFLVFQPFFISTTLPYSVKEGEIINIPVTIFNYLNKNLFVEVTLHNSYGEFEFVEASDDINEILIEDVKRTKNSFLKANSGEYVSFLLRPKRAGHITLKISALTIPPIASDALEQILLVEPEGITQYKNKAVFIDLTKRNEHNQTVKIDIPVNIVPWSIYSEISVAEGLLGPTINNLDRLVRMPYGCGEQNMVNFVPNILVLKYLENLKKLTPVIEEKAKKYLEIGYQRELTYQNYRGSYTVFGNPRETGSTWLTAYVARSFRQAEKYIQIDETVIKRALDFLKSVQSENGNFPENGYVLDQNMIGDGKGIFLTSFTLMAFLENKEKFPEYEDIIRKALNYLINNIDDKTDLYSLSIATYVLQLAGHEQKDLMLEKLQSLTIRQDDVQYWSKKSSASNEIETTSYALMALLESGSSSEDTIPILKWLISQRNSLGGFSSTQETVVGLQALIKFSEKFTIIERNDIEINFTDDKGTTGMLKINDDNSFLLQTHVLSPDARWVSFRASGKGSTLVQVSYRYNVNNDTKASKFKLDVNVKDTETPKIFKMDVCTSFISANNKKTNMVIMEVSLPTGYIADQDNLNVLEKINNIERIETNKGETVIIIYFSSLDNNEVNLPVEGLRVHKVGKQKPVPIIIYDYYDNSRQARTFYSPSKSSLCDVCEDNDCGDGCATKI